MTNKHPLWILFPRVDLDLHMKAKIRDKSNSKSYCLENE
jgi:hypothetical protein